MWFNFLCNRVTYIIASKKVTLYIMPRLVSYDISHMQYKSQRKYNFWKYYTQQINVVWIIFPQTSWYVLYTYTSVRLQTTACIMLCKQNNYKHSPMRDEILYSVTVPQWNWRLESFRRLELSPSLSIPLQCSLQFYTFRLWTLFCSRRDTVNY